METFLPLGLPLQNCTFLLGEDEGMVYTDTGRWRETTSAIVHAWTGPGGMVRASGSEQFPAGISSLVLTAR